MASCTPSLLTVPKLDACLPMPLHNFTWHLSIPKDGTLDLASPTGSLQQSLPGQECNQSISLHVAERGGPAVGQFCFHGAIQKIQAHTNLSVTAKANDFSKSRGPFLNVTFSEEIPGETLFSICPCISLFKRMYLSLSDSKAWLIIYFGLKFNLNCQCFI